MSRQVLNPLSAHVCHLVRLSSQQRVGGFDRVCDERSDTPPDCSLEATPEFKQWQGAKAQRGQRVQRFLRKHRATLLGAASAAALFLLLAVLLPLHGPTTEPPVAPEAATAARPIAPAPSPPRAATQASKKPRTEVAKQAGSAAAGAKPLAQQVEALQRQLAQSQAAAAAAENASHTEAARLQELLAAREAELADWRRQTREAQAAADRRAAEAAQQQADGIEQVPGSWRQSHGHVSD